MVERGIRPDLYFEMFFVYILRSKVNHSYYVGSCKDIEARVEKHNKGLVNSTKRFLPWELMYAEEFDSLSLARKRESQLKSWKKRISLEKLIKNISK